MIDIRVCVECGNNLGEGPLWDVDEQRLYWLDGTAGEIWRCAADGSDVRRWTLPAQIGSMALREEGGAVLALETGLHLFDFASGALERVAHPEEGLDGVRLNDGKVDGRGRFVTGSLDMGTIYDPPETRRPRGSLYRLDADLAVHRLHGGISIANGPCWSPSGTTFYLSDSNLGTIFAYDWDEIEGVPTNKRCFAQGGPREMPDGCTVDAEGYVWSAVNGGYTGIGELRRYAPDGTLDRTIVMPTPRSTSLMFGGRDLDILFVTTMRIAGEVPETPADGHLFAIHGVGVHGLAERRFAG